jgi:predicted nucleotidyltransferase
MNTKKDIINYLQQFNDTYKSRGFQIIGLFGSYARDTQDPFSDIDLSYAMDHEIFHKNNAFAKLIELDNIKKELEQTFKNRVDLIPANTKNSLLQKNLKKEQILI